MGDSFKISQGLNPFPLNDFKVVGNWLIVGEHKHFQQAIDMIHVEALLSSMILSNTRFVLTKTGI